MINTITGGERVMKRKILCLLSISATSFLICFLTEADVKGDEIFTAATEQLQLVSERPGVIRVAARYHRLLAQMQSVLDDVSSVPVSDEARDGTTGKDDPANEEMLEVYGRVCPIEATVRERRMMIEDVLEYASSQTGISVELLAAVAWAESSMIPYAVNVKGKEYHFISRVRAAKMLRGLKTNHVDIGLFQVNYRLWGKPLELEKEELLNTRVCAIMGAMILRHNLTRHRDPWEAIGRYHSGSSKRMKNYKSRVYRVLRIIRTVLMTS